MCVKVVDNDYALQAMLLEQFGEESKETLGVADAKLGGIIKDKLGIPCIYSNGINELMRGLRLLMSELIEGLSKEGLKSMSLGLSHSFSRYKLKFSPDKVDTMIIQVVCAEPKMVVVAVCLFF